MKQIIIKKKVSSLTKGADSLYRIESLTSKDQLHHQMSSLCIQMPVLGCKVWRNTSRSFASLVSMLCRSFFC